MNTIYILKTETQVQVVNQRAKTEKAKYKYTEETKSETIYTSYEAAVEQLKYKYEKHNQIAKDYEEIYPTSKTIYKRYYANIWLSEYWLDERAGQYRYLKSKGHAFVAHLPSIAIESK